MIKTIFLDVDGVLADFRGQCEEYNCIKGYTVNWEIIHTAGEKFWEEIKWTAEGKSVFEYIKKLCSEEDIDLYILTAVQSDTGKIGRLNWLKKNVGLDKHHLIIVDKGSDKTYYASENALLIDDFGKNCDMFVSMGGQAIQFKSFDQMKNELDSKLSY